jgi:hypothetical protein
MSEKSLLQPDVGALVLRTAVSDKAVRRLRMARLAKRIADSLDKLVRAEEKARSRIGHPVWADRLRTR